MYTQRRAALGVEAVRGGYYGRVRELLAARNVEPLDRGREQRADGLVRHVLPTLLHTEVIEVDRRAVVGDDEVEIGGQTPPRLRRHAACWTGHLAVTVARDSLASSVDRGKHELESET